MVLASRFPAAHRLAVYEAIRTAKKLLVVCHDRSYANNSSDGAVSQGLSLLDSACPLALRWGSLDPMRS